MKLSQTVVFKLKEKKLKNTAYNYYPSMVVGVSFLHGMSFFAGQPEGWQVALTPTIFIWQTILSLGIVCVHLEW